MRVTQSSLKETLAVAAIEPALRSIVAYDISYNELHNNALLLAAALEEFVGMEVETSVLTSGTTEEQLWGTIRIPAGDGHETIRISDGILMPQRKNKFGLIVIPDLSQLSLVGLRAATMLVGSRVAHLERDGESGIFQPQLCWLAGCDSSNLSRVSRHLLDRFALRVVDSPRNIDERIALLSQELDRDQAPDSQFSISDADREKIRNASGIWPRPDPETQQELNRYIDQHIEKGARRSITFWHLTSALARFRGASEIQSSHVDQAAKMLGWKPASNKPEPDVEPTDSDDDSAANPALEEPGEQPTTPAGVDPTTNPSPTSTSETPSPGSGEVKDSSSPVWKSDQREELEVVSIPSDPFEKEETTLVQGEFASLQLPLVSGRISSPRGQIVGYRPARDMADLAWVKTIIEALKFQPIRQSVAVGKRNRWLLSPMDLHSYRRAPRHDYLLVALIDFTATRDCQWQQFLVQHLRWAYVNRASVTLIQVGAADVENDLKANRIVASNVLVPRIFDGLGVGAGVATPLAHGFELAAHTLKRAFERQRGALSAARLVVLTDGLGNVPLANSHSGVLKTPVGDEGVRDSILLAGTVPKHSKLEVFMLRPPMRSHHKVLDQLNSILGAEPIDVPEVEEDAA